MKYRLRFFNVEQTLSMDKTEQINQLWNLCDSEIDQLPRAVFVQCIKMRKKMLFTENKEKAQTLDIKGFEPCL